MKKKIFAALLALLTAAASFGLFDCRCVLASCSGTAPAVSASDLPCHQHGNPSTKSNASNKTCCGNCQYTFVAIPNATDNSLNAPQQNQIAEQLGSLLSSAHPSETISPAAVFYQSFDPQFFIQNIFATTYSFHSPPQI